MDLFELFNTPIDELYERGILKEPEPERNKRMILLTLKCSLCQREYRENYCRQNPDRLALGMNCPGCGSYTWELVQAVPYTVYYRSYAMEHASFGDDTRGQCWECGRKHNLTFYTFSNGEKVEVCLKHFKDYHKEMFLLKQKHIPGSHIPDFTPRARYSDDWD